MINNLHTKRLIKFWKIVDETGVHPADAKVVKSYNHKAKSDRKLYVNNFSPIPWVGNLLKAKVLVVMLNPGMSKLSQQINDEKLERPFLARNLSQKNNPSLFYLNAKLKETGGGIYWRRRFKSFVEKYYDNLEDGYAHIARHVCIVQLIAYHSQKDPSSVRSKLPSARIMRDWILDEVKLKQRKVLVIRGYNDIWPEKKPSNSAKLLICRGKLSMRNPSFNPTGRISRRLSQYLKAK